MALVEENGKLYLHPMPEGVDPLDCCPDCRTRLEDCGCGEEGWTDGN